MNMPLSVWLPMRRDRLADAAVRYADNGWRPFPVGTAPDGSNDGKHPLTKWTTTPRFARCELPSGTTGLGIPTGGDARLVVVDVDGDDGRASLAVLEVAHGPLPPTLTSRTGRANGGEHRVFRCPDNLELPRNSAGKIGQGLDVRAEGGYIVVAPSRHASGSLYEWIDRRELAELPAWLHDLMTRPAKAPSPPPPTQQTLPTRPRQAAARQATTTPAERRRDAWRSKALEGAARRVREAPEGQRNHTLNVAALGLGHYVPTGWMDESEARAVLHRAALDVGLGEPETAATIESGMTAGKRDPKEPEDRARPGPAKVRDAPAPTGDAALDALLGRLTRTGHGAVAATSANVADVLRLHPAWKGVLGFNTRASCPVFLRRPPFRFWDDSLTFPVELHDRHKGDLAEWLARSFEAPFSVNPKTALEELDRACREAPFEPLIDHLRGLKWSGECLLDTWLSRYGHAADTPFNRAAGRKWMISSVARAMQPGCKADHVLVFEGPEAAKKSTALETLAYADTHSEWHTDQLPDLENKDSMVQLQGPWIVEMGELATVRKARREKLKAFVSSRVDRFRPPHATLARNFPRRCIFAGTTNETNYFDDPTGNRRFWPVHTPSWDIEALKRDRDQLWAEAVAAFDAGEAWHLDAELEAAARVVQDSRSVDDLWSDRIEAWIGGQETVSVTDCLGELGITEDRRTPTDARRIEGILRRAGWRAYGNQERRGKYKVRLWTAPRTDDAEHVEPVVEVEHVQGVEPVRVVELVQGVEPVVEPVRVVEPDADDETVAAMADDLADDEDRAARTRTATGIGLQSPTAATG